jgi:hypothetical protein
VSTRRPRRDIVVNSWPQSFVKVAPPTVYAGVGNALRQAFTIDGELRSSRSFEDLLVRLDHVSTESKAERYSS